MAKKRVAVSLRKPPPPADLAKLVVEAAQDAMTPPPSSDVRETTTAPRDVAPRGADAFVAAAPKVELAEAPISLEPFEPFVLHEVVPLPPPVAAKIEAPVAVVEPAIPAVKTSAIVSGTTPIVVRLPDSVAARLETFCKENGREVDELIAEILARHLAARTSDPQSAFDSVYRWVRAKIEVVTTFRDRLTAFASGFRPAHR